VRLLEPVNKGRRRIEQRLDQVSTRAVRAVRGPEWAPVFDGAPRFALLTVNFSTTRYLKLMLASLLEQDRPDLLTRIVICDNRSRDGGLPFLRRLAAAVPKVHLVERRLLTSHARGMRACIRTLDGLDRDAPAHEAANVLLECDTDVVFRRPDTLRSLQAVFQPGAVAFAGQLRSDLFPLPEAQASFLAVRRDWAARADVSPWVNHGSPAYFLQRDIWRAGGKGHDFPSNSGGFVLHRGRTAVAATGEFAILDSHASAPNRQPHFMGVPNGAEIWRQREEDLSRWLPAESEAALIEALGTFLR
jgi:hypothetical protein